MEDKFAVLSVLVRARSLSLYQLKIDREGLQVNTSKSLPKQQNIKLRHVDTPYCQGLQPSASWKGYFELAELACSL